ncbi:MAG: type II toxin-antitoxin system VapC family toxin [Patescibacteria group bacterium]
MTKVVIDTSIIIDFTRAGTGQLPDLIEAAKSDEIELFIPTVVILELWIGKSMQQSKNTAAAEKLFSGIKRIDLVESIAKLAGKLLRKNLLTGPMDAVIAASALELNAKLATGNRRHFEKVKNLRLF